MKKTLALLLAVLMVLCLCAACGEKAEEAPAEEPAVEAPVAEEPAEPAAEEPAEAPAEQPASEEPAADASASGEASSGEPQSFELFDAAGYDKTFDGYKQYCMDAINSTNGPADIIANDIATIEAMTEETYDDSALSMYVEFGLIPTYADFIG